MLIVRGAVESSSFVEQFVRGAVRSRAEIEDVDILVSINLPFSYRSHSQHFFIPSLTSESTVETS